MTDFERMMGEQFLEMRWRVLSLAADMDRLQGKGWVRSNAELERLRGALGIVAGDEPGRAERVQMLFSDTSSDIK